MTDMLIKLYDLPATAGPRSAAVPDCVVRKPIGPEHDAAVGWISAAFGARWASEARAALGNRPISLFIALQGERPVGFACYDATARGLVGPIGVDAALRHAGVGAALLRAVLADMRAVGYGYAVAGAVGPRDFFRRVAGAVEIAGSAPGLYAGLLKEGG